MRKMLVVLALVSGCAPAGGGGRIEPTRPDEPMPAALRRSPLTTLDIIHMTQAGLDDDALLDRIAAEGVATRLTPRAEAELRAHGVSQRVIAAASTAEVVPRTADAPPLSDDPQPWWFTSPTWTDDYGRTLHVR